jgi:hypothetical protein
MNADQHRDRRAGPVAPMRASGCTDWPSLMPITIVTYGNGDTDQPIERLLTLQSAVARIVHMVSQIGQLRGLLRYDRISGLVARSHRFKAGPSAPSPREL